MSGCQHTELVLLPMNSSAKLRCTRCALTIKPEELENGYCPECHAVDGKRHEDFETIPGESPQHRYRCAECGIIIEVP